MFGKILKLAKGNFSEDELRELLAAIGMEGSFDEVPDDRKEDAFQRVAHLSVQPGAKVILARLMHKNGGHGDLVLVLTPPRPEVTSVPQKSLDTASGITLPSCQLP